MDSKVWQTPPPDREQGRLGQVRRWRATGLIPPLAALLLGAGACTEGTSSQPEGLAGGGNVAPSGSAGAFSKPEPMDPPGCVPAEEEDRPDADFADTNCDGIDGDRARAVFVAPHGSDDGPGTLEAPIATLTRGIELARRAGKSVYVCTSTYEEAVVLEDAAVSIYGGYDCRHGWRRTSKQATIAPAAGRPLTIRNIAEPLLLSRLRFVAADAAEAGASSVAAHVVDSLNLRFEPVALEAGNGAPGLSGEPAIVHAAPPRAADGKSAPLVADCYTRTPHSTCSRPCTPDLPTLACCAACCHPDFCHAKTLKPECETVITGVHGSPPTLAACASDTGSIRRSSAAGGNGGNGHVNIERTLGAVPSAAPDAGAPGANGVAATDPFGTITSDGAYVPTNSGTAGRFGKMGTAAKGGDGGLAYETYSGGIKGRPAMSGAGGRGGVAGCGGYPGQGGGGGGASIALIAVRSGVELEQAILRTGAGGAGGAPSAGGAGQVGGQPGRGGTNEKGEKTASDGEPGTAGGRGGHGGPGAGGPSVGIVAVASEPLLNATLFDTGVGGLGADSVPGSRMDRGASGLSRDVFLIGVS